MKTIPARQLITPTKMSCMSLRKRGGLIHVASGSMLRHDRVLPAMTQMREEGPPGGVFRIGQFLQQQRMGLGLNRRGLEVHVRFLRRAASFFRVAADAGADDVLPIRLATTAAR